MAAASTQIEFCLFLPTKQSENAELVGNDRCAAEGFDGLLLLLPAPFQVLFAEPRSDLC